MTSLSVVKSPGELIASIPLLLGFEPYESVVVIGIHADHGLGVMMRVDRSDCLIPDVARPLARALAGHLERDGAVTAVLVTYTSADVRASCPAADAVRPIIGEVVDRVEAWAVVRGRHFSPGCADHLCCPPDGREIPEQAREFSERLAVRMVDHVAPPDAGVSAVERKRAQRARARWWAKRDDDLARWRGDSMKLWAAATAIAAEGRALPRGAEAGKLLAALSDVRVRDAVLLHFAPGGAAAARAALAGTDDHLVAAALDAVVKAPASSVPAMDDVERWVRLCETVAGHATGPEGAGPLTVAAALRWWQGDSLAARGLLAAAEQANPHYRLAALLTLTLDAGVMAGWQR